MSYTQEEIGQFKTEDVKYHGWWMFPDFKPLGHTIPLTLPLSSFLNRCKEIGKMLENLRPAPIRNILIELGLKRDDIKQFRALKLLATLAQLAAISHDEGLDLLADRDQIVAQWNAATILPDMTALFELLVLRNMDAHKASSLANAKLGESFKVFGIDQTQCVAGWGLALDRIYDKIVSSLVAIEGSIGKSWT